MSFLSVIMTITYEIGVNSWSTSSSIFLFAINRFSKMNSFTIKLMTNSSITKQQKTSNNARLGMINNPSAAPSAETSRVARAIWAAMQTQTANNAKNFITKMSKEEAAVALEKGVDIGEFAVGVRGDNVTHLCRIMNMFLNVQSACSHFFCHDSNNTYPFPI